MSQPNQQDQSVYHSVWTWLAVSSGSAAAAVFVLAVWVVFFGMVFHLPGTNPGIWVVFACGLFVGLRVGYVWRCAADLGWKRRGELARPRWQRSR